MASTPFETVVRRHGVTVLRVCRAVLGRHADADDAWSETFLSALRGWPDLPDSADVEAWLVTIAHRKCVDQLRSRGRRPLPSADPPDRPSRLGVPDADIVALWDSLRDLPTRQRLAVAYHHLGGLPYRDVAELIGGTPAAARRAGADGIARLRSQHRPTSPPPS